MPFDFEPVDAFAGPLLVRPRRFDDERGWFLESYKRSDFTEQGIPDFVQDNHSFSRPSGVIRGLHYQLPPHGQGKLVRCTRGAVMDALVDIRRGSPTFGAWWSTELDATVSTMLWVPEGFAHGFCTLQPDTEVQYKVTAEYHAAADRSIRWNDPAIGIAWPTETPSVSSKDREAPTLAEAELPERWGTGT